MICLIDPSKPDTWEENIALTFDIEWAHDEILLDTVNILEKAGASVTWFVTHDTPILGRLRDHPCLGACSQACAISIDGEIIGKAAPENLRTYLNK